MQEAVKRKQEDQEATVDDHLRCEKKRSRSKTLKAGEFAREKETEFDDPALFRDENGRVCCDVLEDYRQFVHKKSGVWLW
ncbi:MAG: hypothetical protein KAS07_03945 [Candidatus Pacebacteria bacterium]|nr:hypothetical protein [Candidatus Paceibacterota bacterium]